MCKAENIHSIFNEQKPVGVPNRITDQREKKNGCAADASTISISWEALQLQQFYAVPD